MIRRTIASILLLFSLNSCYTQENTGFICHVSKDVDSNSRKNIVVSSRIMKARVLVFFSMTYQILTTRNAKAFEDFAGYLDKNFFSKQKIHVFLLYEQFISL